MGLPSTYGGGTVTQDTAGTARQILELGTEVHYFNPSETPLLTISGRANKIVTPTYKVEWMEDEHFIQRSQTFTFASSSNLSDSTAGVNDTGSILICDRQSQIELFEKGAIYTGVVAGSAGLESMVAYLCIAIGKEVDLASGTTTDKMVQFVGLDAQSADTFTYDEHASGTAILTTGASGTLTLTYAGTAGEASVSGVQGASATSSNLTDNETFDVRGITGHAEGGPVHKASRKKVRRPKNVTQIFKEPYDITGTAEACLMYGPMELNRLQARKLKKLKVDVEWSMITQTAIDEDLTAENPKRKFQGLGVGGTGGVVASNNGYNNTNMQLTEASFTMTNFDDMLKYVFKDQTEGSMVKDMFVSSDWMSAISARVRAESQVELPVEMGVDASAGLRIVQYRAPIGDVRLIRNPLLEGSLAKYAFIIDWANFDMRPLRTRDLQLQVDIVHDGSDGQCDQWLLEFCPQIMQEQTHAIARLV